MLFRSGEHLLRLFLCEGEEPHAEAGSGNDSLHDLGPLPRAAFRLDAPCGRTPSKPGGIPLGARRTVEWTTPRARVPLVAPRTGASIVVSLTSYQVGSEVMCEIQGGRLNVVSTSRIRCHEIRDAHRGESASAWNALRLLMSLQIPALSRVAASTLDVPAFALEAN